jgi:site-specific DNA-methyltransferase (adenine-specific)
MKPTGLIARALVRHSKPDDLVLDPFGGSGSTLIAAHLTDRSAALIELDPRYVDVICRRYQELTGVVPHNETLNVDVDFTKE